MPCAAAQLTGSPLQSSLVLLAPPAHPHPQEGLTSQLSYAPQKHSHLLLLLTLLLQEGFNAQFSWAFEQLVTLRYRWPFVAPVPAAPGTQAAAAAVNQLINKEILPDAVKVPGLPPMAPAAYEEPGNRGFDEIYAALVGQQPAEELLPEPSDCPVIFCKVRCGLASTGTCGQGGA